MAVPVAGKGVVVTDNRIGEPRFSTMGDPSTGTSAETLTAAKMLSGVLVATIGTSALSYTLPTVAVLEAGIENPRVGMTFDLVVINLGTSSGVLTIATGTGWTLVGTMALPVTGSAGSSAQFRARKTGVGAWTLYRIA